MTDSSLLNTLLFLLISLFPLACASSERVGFNELLENAPNKIWNSAIPSSLRESLQNYDSRKRLPNGTSYGDSLRTLNLSNLCAIDIDSWARAHGCPARNDVLKDPRTHAPLLDSTGKTIPLIAYLCADGGVVRVKPRGNPLDPHELKPNAVKAMRYFGSSHYESFDDEAFKVDNQGRAVPKWPKDLNSSSDTELIDEWGRDSHTELKPCR